MMNRIRFLGAAVAAFAAPVLLAAPAGADTRIETRLGKDTTLTLSLGASGYDDYRRGDYRRGLNAYGQTDREVQALVRDARQACRQAIRYEARNLGYDEVDFDDDQRVRQTAPRGFLVTFDDVEFESRRRDVEARVTCNVRRGDVLSIDGLPRPDRGRGHRPGW